MSPHFDEVDFLPLFMSAGQNIYLFKYCLTAGKKATAGFVLEVQNTAYFDFL